MNTLESLQALSDEELVELCAVEIMGFTKIVRKLQGPRLVTTWLRDPGDFVNKAKKWEPLIDRNHLHDVKERMVELHLAGSFTLALGRIICRIISGDFNREPWNSAAHAVFYATPREICLAALLAVS